MSSDDAVLDLPSVIKHIPGHAAVNADRSEGGGQ